MEHLLLEILRHFAVDLFDLSIHHRSGPVISLVDEMIAFIEEPLHRGDVE